MAQRAIYSQSDNDNFNQITEGIQFQFFNNKYHVLLYQHIFYMHTVIIYYHHSNKYTKKHLYRDSQIRD